MATLNNQMVYIYIYITNSIGYGLCNILSHTQTAQQLVDHQFITVSPKNLGHPIIQWIGLRENLQESPIFNGEIHGFLQNFP